jgi:hypothetical protein
MEIDRIVTRMRGFRPKTSERAPATMEKTMIGTDEIH